MLEYYTRKQYEECAKNEQSGTTSAIKEEDEASDDGIIEPYEPCTSPPPLPLQEEMLIDVKAEQMEVIECDKPDDSSTSVVNFSILS